MVNLCPVRHQINCDRWRVAKGGGPEIGPTKRGKGMKIMAIVDRHGLPLSVSMHAANHHEVRLVQLCFDLYMIEAKPDNLIGDRAYDSDPLDEELRRDDIKMIAPHRSNRIKPPTQDRRRHKPLYATLAYRALFHLDTMTAPDPHPLVISHAELSWLRTARLPHYPLFEIGSRKYCCKRLKSRQSDEIYDRDTTRPH
jgi:hypothetical protein